MKRIIALLFSLIFLVSVNYAIEQQEAQLYSAKKVVVVQKTPKIVDKLSSKFEQLKQTLVANQQYLTFGLVLFVIGVLLVGFPQVVEIVGYTLIVLGVVLVVLALIGM